jgi:hypothetical protein
MFPAFTADAVELTQVRPARDPRDWLPHSSAQAYLRGWTVARDARVVVIGLVRNSGQETGSCAASDLASHGPTMCLFRRMLADVRNLVRGFKDHRILILENDSDDNTQVRRHRPSQRLCCSLLVVWLL